MGTILQWNCRGLANNHTELCILSQQCSPVAICLQETRIADINKVSFKGYAPYHRLDTFKPDFCWTPQNFLGIEVDADAHRSLNVSKGVIRDFHQDLRDMSEEDIRLELASQGVLRVSRFILKKEGKEIKTNTLFLTFDNHVPPEKLKIGYYVVTVQPYIPNPLRCFQCQKFGHSKKWCKNKLACWKCGSEGHDGSECTSETTSCLNCKGNHCASSKSCPVWIQEKEIQRVKTEKCLSYGDARRLVTSASSFLKRWIPHTLLDLQGRSLVHAVGRKIFLLLSIINGYHITMELSRISE